MNWAKYYCYVKIGYAKFGGEKGMMCDGRCFYLCYFFFYGVTMADAKVIKAIHLDRPLILVFILFRKPVVSD